MRKPANLYVSTAHSFCINLVYSEFSSLPDIQVNFSPAATFTALCCCLFLTNTNPKPFLIISINLISHSNFFLTVCLSSKTYIYPCHYPNPSPLFARSFSDILCFSSVAKMLISFSLWSLACCWSHLTDVTDFLCSAPAYCVLHLLVCLRSQLFPGTRRICSFL